MCLDDLQQADAVTLLALRLLPARLASYPIAWILARSRGKRGSRAGISSRVELARIAVENSPAAAK